MKNILLGLLISSSVLAQFNPLMKYAGVNFENLKKDIFNKNCYQASEAIHCLHAIQKVLLGLKNPMLILPNSNLHLDFLPLVDTYTNFSDQIRLYQFNKNEMYKGSMAEYVKNEKMIFDHTKNIWAKHFESSSEIINFEVFFEKIIQNNQFEENQETFISYHAYNEYLVSKFGENTYLSLEDIDLKLINMIYGKKIEAEVEKAKKEAKEKEQIVFYPGFQFSHKKGKYIIKHVEKDTIAYLKGMRVDDEVYSINGVKLRNQDFESAMKLIKEKINSKVSFVIHKRNGLRVEKFGINIDFEEYTAKTLEFDYIEENKTLYFQFDDFLDQRIPMIMMTVYKTYNEILGVDGIILDLRNNGGGSLMIANQIADLFLKGNKNITYSMTINDKGEMESEVYKSQMPELMNEKLIVMVNNNSASASELLTQALVDNSRALSIGQRTYGKGSIQVPGKVKTVFPESKLALISLRENSGLFFGPNKKSNHLHGITPHFVLDSKKESYTALDSSKNPIASSMNDSVKYKASTMVERCFKKNKKFRKKGFQRSLSRSEDSEYLATLDLMDCIAR